MFVLNYAPWVLGENTCSRVRVWIKALKTLELAPVPRKDPLTLVVFIPFLCLPPGSSEKYLSEMHLFFWYWTKLNPITMEPEGSL